MTTDRRKLSIPVRRQEVGIEIEGPDEGGVSIAGSDGDWPKNEEQTAAYRPRGEVALGSAPSPVHFVRPSCLLSPLATVLECRVGRFAG